MKSLQLSSEDRRQHVRFPFSQAASFQHEGGIVAGLLADISFFGALFEMDEDHALSGKDGALRVPFGRDPEEAVLVNAKVAYRRDRSVGLSWEALAPENIIKVRRLAEISEGKPWLLMRSAHVLFWSRHLA
ncbi:MAG: PilZ domain-containing protein [Betaproteobacteria bacterium]|nr:PilZ domain-containing protein [Betaproteobacteria bacterium]